MFGIGINKSIIYFTVIYFTQTNVQIRAQTWNKDSGMTWCGNGRKEIILKM